MSQLKKSASFRSRIPVRARLPQRRCSSPQPTVPSKSRQSKKASKFFFDRYYSSSSFSSSDESHDSEEPLKVSRGGQTIFNRAPDRVFIEPKPFRNRTSNFSELSSARRDIQSRHEGFHGDMQRAMRREHKLISIVDVVC